MTNQTTARTKNKIVNDLAMELASTRVPMMCTVGGLRAQVTLPDLSAKLAKEHAANTMKAKTSPLPKHMGSIITSTRSEAHNIFKQYKGIKMPTMAGVAYAVPIASGAACVQDMRALSQRYTQAIWSGVMGNTPTSASDQEIAYAWSAYKTKYIEPAVGAAYMNIAFPFASPQDYVETATCTFKALPMTPAMVSDDMVLAAEIQSGITGQTEEIYEALVQSAERIMAKTADRLQEPTPFKSNSFNAIWTDFESLRDSLPASCVELQNAMRWALGSGANGPAKYMRSFFDQVCSLPSDPAEAADGKYQDIYRPKMLQAVQTVHGLLRPAEPAEATPDE